MSDVGREDQERPDRKPEEPDLVGLDLDDDQAADLRSDEEFFASELDDEYYTYDATDEERSGPGLFLVAGLGVLIAAFAGVLFFAYRQGMEEGERAAPPFIAADSRPAKVAPVDPGGLTIPHQDKNVYDRVSGEVSEPVAETLLPAAEEPMAVPDISAADNAAAEAIIAVDPLDGPGIEVRAAPLELPRPVAAASPPDTTIPTVPDIAEAPPAVAQPVFETAAAVPSPVPSAVPPAPAVAADGAYVVQLASFRDSASAENQFITLQKKFPNLLGGVPSDIERADLGDKGIYYRLRAGPFADAPAARTLCAGLKSGGQDCLVRRIK